MMGVRRSSMPCMGPQLFARLAMMWLLVLSLLAGQCRGQFGVPKAVNSILSSGEDRVGHQERRPNTDGHASASAGFLSDSDAGDMEAILAEAKRDVETMRMVTQMKAQMSDELDELRKLSTEEVLGGMKQALDEMKLLDVLFQDKARALREMEKEGMIAKSHLKEYRKNPDLLEQDTRKGLYFQFISLAVVGGFLE